MTFGQPLNECRFPQRPVVVKVAQANATGVSQEVTPTATFWKSVATNMEIKIKIRIDAQSWGRKTGHPVKRAHAKFWNEKRESLKSGAESIPVRRRFQNRHSNNGGAHIWIPAGSAKRCSIPTSKLLANRFPGHD